MTPFPTLKLLFVQKYSCLYNKKKITRRPEDMNFYILVVKNTILPLENKIHIFPPACNVLDISSASTHVVYIRSELRQKVAEVRLQSELKRTKFPKFYFFTVHDISLKSLVTFHIPI